MVARMMASGVAALLAVSAFGQGNFVVRDYPPEDLSMWHGRRLPWYTADKLEKFRSLCLEAYAMFCDLVISGIVGFLPRADGTFDVKPLAPREWEWYSLKNLRHCGHVVDIDYSRGQGLVVNVDGKAVQTR